MRSYSADSAGVHLQFPDEESVATEADLTSAHSNNTRSEASKWQLTWMRPLVNIWMDQKGEHSNAIPFM